MLVECCYLQENAYKNVVIDLENGGMKGDER